MSQFESTVWHAVVALGTLHETFAIDDEELRLARHKSGVKHYNKAITRMISSTGTESQSAESVLVSCIVFICIEISLGNVEAARNHLQGGIHIIRSLDTPGSLPTFYQSKGQLLKTNLKPVFEHFSSQRFIYGQILTPDAQRHQDIFIDVPDTFADYCEARDHLTSLFLASYQLAVKSLYGPDQSLDRCTRLLDEKHDLQMRLDRWLITADDLLTRVDLSKVDHRRMSQIKLSHKCACMWLSTALNPDEMLFDAYVYDYDALVKLSRLSLNKCSTNSVEPSALPDERSHVLQSVSPLFLIVTKCRNPRFRREALALLRRHPPVMRFWDPKLLVRVLERVIELEEEGLEELWDPTGAIVPSEWARIQSITANLDHDNDKMVTIFFQRTSSVVEERWSRF
ncbi:hypothetical protein VTL71DRAFT_10455 [Oculimacula yallundae]|uniref:C6 zinc finger domain protein n=1 Tax=Oculimacula yallundae TaxID=86028 RepID=A0ABR4CUJ7_9HELO